MKKRLYLMAIIITLVLSILMINVQAADLSYTASMKASSDSVEKGKEFTITLSVSNIKAGDKGINSLSGYLEFDDKVFEDITSDSIEGTNDWSATYSEDTGKITLLKTSFVKETQDVCQITLKAKSSTTSTKGTVEFKDIVASNSESEITADDISLEVEIGAETADEDEENSNNTIKITSNTNKNTNKNNTNKNTNRNTTNNNNNKNTNKTTNKNNVNSIVANTNKNNTNRSNNVNTANIANETAEEEMPDTGIDDTIVKAIILVSLVGVVGYMKMRSLEQK